MKRILKNTFAICFLLLGMGLFLSPSVKADLNTAQVTISPSKLTMAVGETTSLQVSEGAITWSSSAPSVVTVSNEGVLKAVGTGNAVITAKLNKETATCKVKVIDAFMGRYSDFLKEMEEADTKTRFFALVDMEQDEFPELVVATSLNKDVLYNVYTVKNKSVKKVGYYVNTRTDEEQTPKVTYSSKYKSLLQDWTNEENTSHTLALMKLKKNKLKINKQLLHYIQEKTLLEVYETGTKGKKVSEEEAKSYKEKYFSDYTTISMQENTAQNRKTVLGR